MVNTATVSEAVVVAVGWKVAGGLHYGCRFAPRIVLSLEFYVDPFACLFGSFGCRLARCRIMLTDRRDVPGMFGTASQIVLRSPL